MRTHIASETGACYNGTGVTLATGNVNSVEQFFDTMFDIYSQHPSPGVTGNAPSVNVRKGYLPGQHANAPDWCSSSPADANPSNTALTYPSDITSGKVTHNSNSVTLVANTTGVVSGEPIVDNKGYLGSTRATRKGSTTPLGTTRPKTAPPIAPTPAASAASTRRRAALTGAMSSFRSSTAWRKPHSATSPAATPIQMCRWRRSASSS